MADVFTLLDQWLWITGLAFSIMTAFVALVYVLGSILLNEKMKTWAKMELVEIFYSGMIIALVVGSIPIMDGVVQGVLGVSNLGGHSITQTWLEDDEAGLYDESFVDICDPDGDISRYEFSVYHDLYSCHIRLATYYLRSIFNEGKTFAYTVYRSYMFSSIMSELSINVEMVFEQSGFFTLTPWRGFFTMGNTIKELCFDWSMKIMQLAKFQELLIRFIATALFPSLFVLGAVLRTFAFTRRLGGLLLALAITLYFIFPAFYAFGGLVVLHMKEVGRSAWMGSPANVDGTHDPPIINTLYATGQIEMIGGNLTHEEMQDELESFEEMNADEYARYVQDEGFTPQIDLSSNAYDEMSETEKDSAYSSYMDGMKTWFGSVSKKRFIDSLITRSGTDPGYWNNNGFLEILSRLAFFSLFFALFGIIGTIAAIRSISTTFGGDIEIAGLTRLI